MDDLTLLGRPSKVPAAPSRETLEAFPNPHPDRDYLITFSFAEFTCLCPVTGQPDFAEIRIAYVPAERCVELKSLKFYFYSYRSEGAFHEAVTNRIADDLFALLAPRAVEVIGDFSIRGGIKTVVTAAHGDRALLAHLRT